MVARLEGISQPRPGDEGADRKSSPERLGAGQRVGNDPGLFVCPKRAGPPHPGLDLVEYERGAGAVARLPRGLEKLVGYDMDPRLPLDRLEQDRGSVLVYRGRQRVGMFGHDDEPGDKRRERRLL